MKNKSDEELLQQLKLGSESAFRTIFEKYWRGVYYAANQLLKSEELSKKVVENLFRKMWTKSSDITNLRDFIFHELNKLILESLHRIAKEYKKKDEGLEIRWIRKIFPGLCFGKLARFICSPRRLRR